MARVGGATEPYMRDDDDDVRKAARGLESHFLKQMLSEVNQGAASGGGGALDGGFAGSTFKEMLDGALADSMAKAGGVGLAKIVEKELEHSPAAAKAAGLKISR